MKKDTGTLSAGPWVDSSLLRSEAGGNRKEAGGPAFTVYGINPLYLFSLSTLSSTFLRVLPKECSSRI